jgi:ABC-2 type transport system permease protein
MDNLTHMIWIEFRKAFRSKVPLLTSLGFLFMPLAIAFLIYVSRNPEIAQKLGLVSAKADLLSASATNWPSYLTLFTEMMAMGGFIFFCLITSWIFGREFSDGTVKDFLAVPIPRSSILIAKFIVIAIWSITLVVVSYLLTLALGSLFQLPQGSQSLILESAARVAVTTGLVLAGVIPFAYFASIGRGYLLPMGLAFLMLILVNVIAMIGWGAYFPWAIPGLYSQADSSLMPVSYWIVGLTGIIGLLITFSWWKNADQSH